MKQLKEKPFTWSKRIRSFVFAFKGIIHLFKYQHNARIHFSILVIVISLGLYLRISNCEWVYITIVSGFVIASELINSSIEYLCDIVSPDFHQLIEHIKDMAAAAVLIAAISSLIIGFLIFIPKILALQ